MWEMLDSDLEFLVDDGFLYMPLLYDPDIEKEAEERIDGAGGNGNGDRLSRSGTLLKYKGNYFIKTINLHSLPESYRRSYASEYENLKTSFLKKYSRSPLRAVSIDRKLRIILFEILPHFVRIQKGLKRRKIHAEAVIDYIAARILIPDEYFDRVTKFLDLESLQKTIESLSNHEVMVAPPRDGLTSGRELYAWLRKAMEVHIVQSEKERLQQAVLERGAFVGPQRKYIATLLYLSDTGSLDLNGFGFFRMGSDGDYIVYKHTGEYALSDYYGRIYLFPDCRVAVDTSGPLRPIVLDTYKHPLLPDNDAWQKICVRRFYVPEKEFDTRAVIRALEDGINALFYGYNNRHYNGYYKLETTIRHIRTLDFDDYVVPRDHPKILSGEVEIKNGFVS